MHQRYFGGQQLECIYWDGVTDYTVAEATEEVRAGAHQLKSALCRDLQAALDINMTVPRDF